MTDLYNDILAIANNYMGIVGEEYIRRRCNVSFGLKNPADIKKQDIERLAESVAMTAEVYLSSEKVKEFKEEILRLKNKVY